MKTNEGKSRSVNDRQKIITLSTFVLFLAEVSTYGTFHCSARCCACICITDRSLVKSDLFPTNIIGIVESIAEFFTRNICSLQNNRNIYVISEYCAGPCTESGKGLKHVRHVRPTYNLNESTNRKEMLDYNANYYMNNNITQFESVNKRIHKYMKN